MNEWDILKDKIARSMCEWKNEPCPGGCICEFRANAALTAIEKAGYVIVPQFPSDGVIIGKSLHHLTDADSDDRGE